MSPRLSMGRKALITGALVTGVGFGAAGVATAATSSSSAGTSHSTSNTSGPASGAPAPPAGANVDPSKVAHGPNETLLTGTDLQKADAAAEAAEPGATIIRAETDSSGVSKYEVHMKKADGSFVTVELDANFNAVKTASGFGAGPGGGRPGDGQPPAGVPGGATGSSAAA